jgi:hypothetical protein
MYTNESEKAEFQRWLSGAERLAEVRSGAWTLTIDMEVYAESERPLFWAVSLINTEGREQLRFCRYSTSFERILDPIFREQEFIPAEVGEDLKNQILPTISKWFQKAEAVENHYAQLN